MQKEEINSLVGFALGNMHNESIARNIIKGGSKYTEHYAYADIFSHLSFTSHRDETFALRLAALIAKYKLPYDKELRFGAWAERFGKDKVEIKLLQLVKLDRQQAIDSISRILQQLKDAKSGFDWYDLARVLYWWGNGIDKESLETRQSILRDYYHADYKSSKSEDNKERDTNND